MNRDILPAASEVLAHLLWDTEADVEAMYKQFIPLQVDALPNYCDLIPGVPEAMAEFRRVFEQRGVPDDIARA